MVHITRGQINTVYFTLTESKTTTAPFFLLVLTNDMTKEVVKFYPTILANTQRVTPLKFTEPTDASLSPEGFWTYEVYESTDNTVKDLTDAAILGLLEKGKAFVKDDNVTEVSYTEHTNETTNTVYIKI